MGFFLSIHFFTFRKQFSQLLLGAFLFAFSYEIALILLEPHDIASHLLTFGNAFLYMPLLYMYVLSVNQPSFTISRTKLVLFSLWLTDSLYKIYWLLQPAPQQQVYLKSTQFEVYGITTGLLSYIFALVLLVILWKYLKLSDNPIPAKMRGWLQKLVLTLLIFNSLWLTEEIINISMSENLFSLIMPEISTLGTLVTVCWVGFSTLQGFYISELPKKSKHKQVTTLEPLTTKQLLVYEQLDKLLRSKKLYAQPDLSLTNLADELGVKSKTLSKIIHSQTGTHYYDYINQLRVEEFKALMHSRLYQKLSIEGMAKQVGFKSKSTFYTCFKKMENLTPGEYQRRLVVDV